MYKMCIKLLRVINDPLTCYFNKQITTLIPLLVPTPNHLDIWTICNAKQITNQI